jgi:hypothetical protein
MAAAPRPPSNGIFNALELPKLDELESWQPMLFYVLLPVLTVEDLGNDFRTRYT